jgi:hypothetical protein
VPRKGVGNALPQRGLEPVKIEHERLAVCRANPLGVVAVRATLPPNFILSPQAVARSTNKIAPELQAIPDLEFSLGVWRPDLLDPRLRNGAADRAEDNRRHSARKCHSDNQLLDAALHGRLHNCNYWAARPLRL